MIASKTYIMIEGSNFIEGSELAFTEIYLVKREGIQHDKYLTGDSNRTHNYSPSLGRITFPTTSTGEKVFVVFKTSTYVPPPPCIPVTLPAISMPNAVVGVPYSYIVLLTGSTPFTVGADNLPSGLSASLISGVLTISGTPDTAGLSQTVEVEDIQNCGGPVTLSTTINVYPANINLYVQNNAPSSLIHGISGFDVLLIDSFPVSNPNTLQGYHGEFTAEIHVGTSASFPQTLRLLRNGTEIQSLSVSTTSGDNVFASAFFLESDEIKIILN